MAIISRIQINGADGPAYCSAGQTLTLTNHDNTGITHWKWTLVDRPAGSVAQLTQVTGPVTQIQLDREGTYLFQLEVNQTPLLPQPVTSRAGATILSLVTHGRYPAATESAEFSPTRGWTQANNDWLAQVEANNVWPHYQYVVTDPSFVSNATGLTPARVVGYTFQSPASPIMLPVVANAYATSSATLPASFIVCGLYNGGVIANGTSAGPLPSPYVLPIGPIDSGTPLYVSDTGEISTAPGTVSQVVGYAIGGQAFTNVLAACYGAGGGGSSYLPVTPDIMNDIGTIIETPGVDGLMVAADKTKLDEWNNTRYNTPVYQEENIKIVYANEFGDDITGDGTQGNPYRTLVKALSIVPYTVENSRWIIDVTGLGYESLPYPGIVMPSWTSNLPTLVQQAPYNPLWPVLGAVTIMADPTTNYVFQPGWSYVSTPPSNLVDVSHNDPGTEWMIDQWVGYYLIDRQTGESAYIYGNDASTLYTTISTPGLNMYNPQIVSLSACINSYGDYGYTGGKPVTFKNVNANVRVYGLGMSQASEGDGYGSLGIESCSNIYFEMCGFSTNTYMGQYGDWLVKDARNITFKSMLLPYVNVYGDCTIDLQDVALNGGMIIGGAADWFQSAREQYRHNGYITINASGLALLGYIDIKSSCTVNVRYCYADPTSGITWQNIAFYTDRNVVNCGFNLADIWFQDAGIVLQAGSHTIYDLQGYFYDYGSQRAAIQLRYGATVVSDPGYAWQNINSTFTNGNNTGMAMQVGYNMPRSWENFRGVSPQLAEVSILPDTAKLIEPAFVENSTVSWWDNTIFAHDATLTT